MMLSAKKLTVAFLLLSSIAFSQRVYDNYSIDLNYGLSGAYEPSISKFGHMDFGFRYMFGEKWGVKLDYGADKFRTKETPEMGTDYQRISVQAACNLSNLLDDRSYFYNEYFVILSHAGLGYAWQKSVTFPKGGPGIDEIPHVIFGVNPQLTVMDGVAIGLDATGIMNLAQHVKFDGTRVSKAADNATTTFTYNLSLGVSFTFGGR
ncbi:hypothetical protein [Flavobacterium pedocola]